MTRGELLNSSTSLSDIFDARGQTLLFAPGYPVEIPHALSGIPPIAIIDSGIDRRHPQLKNLVLAAHDFTGTGQRDAIGHGTAVALQTLNGSAAAAGKPMPLALLDAKVADRNVGPTVPWVVQAIDWAVGKGANVVNLSLGFRADAIKDDERKALCAAIARHKDTLFLAAAGNFGPSVKMLPATCPLPNVQAVGDATPKSGAAELQIAAHPFVPLFEIHLAEAHRLIEQKNFAAAHAALERSLAAAPNPDAYLQLGLINTAEGHQPEAVRYLSEGARRFPKIAMLQAQLGGVLIRAGHPSDAEHALQAALQLDPGDLAARHNLAIALVELGRFDEAIAAARAVKAKKADYPGIDQLLADAQRFKIAAQNR